MVRKVLILLCVLMTSCKLEGDLTGAKDQKSTRSLGSDEPVPSEAPAADKPGAVAINEEPKPLPLPLPLPTPVEPDPIRFALSSLRVNDSCNVELAGEFSLLDDESMESSLVTSSYGTLTANDILAMAMILPDSSAKAFTLNWNAKTSTREQAGILGLELYRKETTQLRLLSSDPATNASGSLARGLETVGRSGGCDASCKSGVRGSIAANWHHACALNADQTLSCWGRNAHGQLGINSTDNQNTAVLVGGEVPLTSVKQVSVGAHHSCALLNDGKVKCWGYNLSGQLGIGSNVDSLVPVTVHSPDGSGELSGIVSISAGVFSACAISEDSEVYCWGNVASATRPVKITQLGSNVIDIAAGYSHACAVLSTGKVRCWGTNGNGQLGQGTFTTLAAPDANAEVIGLSDAVAVSVGNSYSCALVADGTVKCWGTSWSLGDGSESNRSAAGIVPNVTGAVALNAGPYYACALLSTGVPTCWYTAAEERPLEQIVGLANFEFGECFLKSDGTVQCKGQNTMGEVGNGSFSADAQDAYAAVSSAKRFATLEECTYLDVKRAD